MADFDEDGAGGSGDDFDNDNDDEEMEDVNDGEQDQDQGQDDEDEDEDNEDNEGDNDEDDDEDQNEPESPSRRASQHASAAQKASSGDSQAPDVVRTSASPRGSVVRSPSGAPLPFIPPTRPEALTALAYDIVPTMAAPQSTSINAIAATPDMRWVFSGGADGYVRMFNWVETANGKVPLTVAQKHPFVDSVMKAGSLVTYWENEEALMKTPPSQPDDGKWNSPVYSLAVQHQALWLLSGLESGGINLQTCRHQAGTRITTLKDHTSAVSVLTLSQDETGVLSGSWDKTILDWDLQTGSVKRSFKGVSGQVSAIQVRPTSDLPIPEVTETVHESLTFSSNNADRPSTNGIMTNGNDRRESKAGDEDAMGSPSSLFGEDHGSLFGEDTGGGGGGGNAFGDDEDDLTRALANGLQEEGQDASKEADAEMGGMGNGGPVQPPEPTAGGSKAEETSTGQDGKDEAGAQDSKQPSDDDRSADVVMNGMPHSDEPLTAPPTDEALPKDASAADLPPQSESTFLDAAFDGTLRIWDRRMSNAIATIAPYGGTSPWCTGACWSPDGNYIYAGRRNCTVDEFSIHKMSTTRNKPERVFKFQTGSGPVYSVKAMPNGRHLVW